MSAADLPRLMEIAQGLPEAPHWTEAAYRAALDPKGQPQRTALVAEADESFEAQGLVVGFAVACRVRGEAEAELELIAVAAEKHRRGIGRQLLKALIAELEASGVVKVLLEARASNRAALGLYAALGFERIGTRPRYYDDPQEDAVLMALQAADLSQGH
jgi:ribosomal-protein-alanine N-acetyltransferase